MLSPVQLIKPAPALAEATVRLWSPGPEPPAAVDVLGEMVSETGARYRWERRLKVAGRLKSQAVPGGFRVAVRLPLPADLELGYYDLTLKVRSGGREESGRTRLIAAPPQAYAPAWLEEGRRAWGFNLPLYALRSRANWGVGDFADLMDGHPLGRTPGGGVCGGQSPPCGRGASHSRPQSLFPHQPDFPQCFVPEPGGGAGDGGLPEGPGSRGQPGISGR